MLKRLLPFFAALAVSAPLYAQAAPDPACQESAAPDTICVGRTGEGYSFSFVYPRSAAEIPALHALLVADSARALAWMETTTRDYRRDRAANGGEPLPLSFDAAWEIDARLPEIVAASGTISRFTGGAHGGIEYQTILIDPRHGRQVRLADLFRFGTFDHSLLGHRPRGRRAVQTAFCRALTAAVRDRRDEPAALIECPAVEEQPVTLVCGERGRIEAMRALLNPYVAGSWAEGPYEVDVPIDAEMMSAMRRRYRAAFGLAQEIRARTPTRPCR